MSGALAKAGSERFDEPSRGADGLAAIFSEFERTVAGLRARDASPDPGEPPEPMDERELLDLVDEAVDAVRAGRS